MKKYLIYSLLVVALMLTGCPEKDEKEIESAAQKSAVKAITSLLPEDTEVFVKFSSMEALYTYCSVTDASVLGTPVDLGELQEVLGLNPLNLEELKTAGVDSQKPIAIAVTDFTIDNETEASRFTSILLIPVTDSKKAVATITAAFEKEGSGFTVTEDGKLTVFTNADHQTTLYLAVKDDYVLFGGNPEQDAKSAFASILSGDSELAKASAYEQITSGLNAYDDVFAYINIAAIVRQNAEALTQRFQTSPGMSGVPAVGAGLAYVEEYKAIGASLDLESPDFVLNTLVTMTDDARSKKLWEDIQIDKSAALSIAESPLLFLSWAVNVAEYYQLVAEAQVDNAGDDPPVTNPLDGPLGAFEAMSGIDVEDEIAKNLGGNVNLGVYDGNSITMTNYNTLLSFTVKDEAAMQAVLDKAIKAVPAPQQSMITTQTIDDVEAYVAVAGLTQVYLGIHNKQVILTTGKPLFQKALAGKVSDGFSASMKPEELAETLQNTGNVFYLNVDEVVKAVRNFEVFLQGFAGGPGAMQDIYTAAGKFEYLMASSRLDGNAIATDIQIKTRFTKPFLLEVVDVFNELGITSEAPPDVPIPEE